MKDGRARVVILAAMPRELAGLTTGWKRQVITHNERTFQIAVSDNALAISAGMGPDNAARALEVALAASTVSAVVSAGFAGALDTALRVGAVIRASQVVDAQTGERFATTQGDGATLVTVGTIADAVEKRRLAATYSAQAADMEAATLARICMGRQLPFFAIKAISDDADFSLPALAQFATASGQFRTAAFVLHVAIRPGLWGKVRELSAGAKAAQSGLAAELRAFLSARAAQQLS